MCEGAAFYMKVKGETKYINFLIIFVGKMDLVI